MPQLFKLSAHEVGSWKTGHVDPFSEVSALAMLIRSGLFTSQH